MSQMAVLPTEAIIAAELRSQIIKQVLIAIHRLWNQNKAQDPLEWFTANAVLYAELVTRAQAELVHLAATSTDETLAAQGYAGPTAMWADPLAFAGIDMAGRDVTGIAYAQALKVTALMDTKDYTFADLQQVWNKAHTGLMLMTQTALSDTSRQAKIAQMQARPGTKFIRMVRPPCCARCAILAGKVGGEKIKFHRHPGCDCDAIPVADFDRRQEQLVKDGWILDANDYFNSLSEKQQNQIFTKSGAQAIRDGADINQVINSRKGMDAHGVYTTEGTTKRGWASEYLRAQYDTTLEKRAGSRYRRTRRGRLSVNEIYRRASNSDEALVLLHANGYLTDASPDLSGKFDFFLRDAEVKAAQMRVRQAKLSAIAAKQARLTDSGTGGPPLIPPEVFKLVDEGDGDWRSRITADAGISKKAIHHEWASFVQLAKNGHAVHLRRDSDVEGVANPDIYLDGVLTEVKTPKGGTKNTIAGIVRKAKSQSSQVVIDTIRANLSVAEIEAYSRKALERYTEVKRIMVMSAEKEVWVSNE